jgi:hypothetical protein
MIATVDLFEWTNFNYTATPLRDQRLLDLIAHPYVRASQDKHQQGWLARKTNQSTSRPGVVLESQGKPEHQQ